MLRMGFRFRFGFRFDVAVGILGEGNDEGRERHARESCYFG